MRICAVISRAKLENVEAKRRYIYQLWKKRDPKPETPVNEFRTQYKKRIEVFLNTNLYSVLYY